MLYILQGCCVDGSTRILLNDRTMVTLKVCVLQEISCNVYFCVRP